MSRVWLTSATSVAILALAAAPALAAETGGAEAAKGSAQGIVLAFVLGILFGVGLATHAYRNVRFGADEAHQEQAHDVREGFGDHATPTG